MMFSFVCCNTTQNFILISNEFRACEKMIPTDFALC